MSNQVDELIELARKGDHHAYSNIVRLMQQDLFRYCYPMMMNREDAEDMVQETFIRAYENLGKYREQGQFKGWLFTIANRTCLNKLKRRHRFRALTKKLGEETSRSTLVEDSNLEALSLLDSISPKARAVMVLRVLHDMSYEEISHILGMSTSSLRKQYERARKQLVEQHEGDEGELRGGIKYEC